MRTERGSLTLCFIAVVLLLLFAVGEGKAYAENFGGGAGTKQDPYLITTAEQLAQIGNDQEKLAAHYRLENDIDLQLTYTNWQPIGGYATAQRFKGSLDGNGYTISGLFIDNPNGQYLGLFASLDSTAKVHNLKLTDVSIKGNIMIGGLAGINRGIIEDVHVTGDIQGTYQGINQEKRYIGGLVGRNTNSTALIKNSSFTGDIKGDITIGGIAGESISFAKIESSHASGTVTAGKDDSFEVGGLVGENGGSIIYSYAENAVTANGKDAESIGGLVGYNYNSYSDVKPTSATISFSFATGEVTGGTSVGGLVGYNNGEILNSFATGNVSSSSKGFLGNNGHIGGLVGLNQEYGFSHNNSPYQYDGGIIKFSYSTGFISAPNFNNRNVGGFVGTNTRFIENSYTLTSQRAFAGTDSKETVNSAAVSQAALLQKNTFVQWDFDEVWAIEAGEKAPQLRYFLSPSAQLLGIIVNDAIEIEHDADRNLYTVIMPKDLNEAIFQLLTETYMEATVVQDGERLEKITENDYLIPLNLNQNSTITVTTKSPNGKNQLQYTIEFIKQKAEYPVHFVVNGGIAIASQFIIENQYLIEPPAPIREGYHFVGWYVDQESFTQPFDFTNTAITEEQFLYAKWKNITELTLTIESEGGAVTGQEANYVYGSYIHLSAVPDEGYRFVGWIDAATGKTLSIQESYSFTITRHMQLIASFTEIKMDYYIVTFINESGRILSVQKVEKGSEAIAPPAPAKPDAQFIGWSIDFSDVQSDLTIKPVYSNRVSTYQVNVIGGVIPSGITEYVFDSLVTVVADEPIEGLQFSHWVINGNIVSYNRTFSFYITSHTTINAVYAEMPIVSLPIVSIHSEVIASPETNRLSFIGKIDLAGHKLIECGLVVKRSDHPLTELHLGSAGAIRAKSSSQTSTGQFMMNKTGVLSGETWYAAAYLIYQDSTGQVITIYSEVVSGTMP